MAEKKAHAFEHVAQEVRLMKLLQGVTEQVALMLEGEQECSRLALRSITGEEAVIGSSYSSLMGALLLSCLLSTGTHHTTLEGGLAQHWRIVYARALAI